MKIKYFNQFLFESVSNYCENITEEVAKNILNEAIDYFGGFDNIPLLYRGIRSSSDYMIQDMKNADRVSFSSVNQKSINILNLYLSYDEKFEKFNRRNKSVIFTNNKNEAQNYGNAYIVLPLNRESKISYIKTNDLYSITDTTATIEEKIESIILITNFLGVELPELDLFTRNYNAFETLCEVFDKQLNSLKKKINEYYDDLYVEYALQFDTIYDEFLKQMINAILNSDNIESLLENYIFKSDNSRTIISKSIFNETYKNLKNNNDFKLDSIELLTEEKCALIRLGSDVFKG